MSKLCVVVFVLVSLVLCWCGLVVSHTEEIAYSTTISYSDDIIVDETKLFEANGLYHSRDTKAECLLCPTGGNCTCAGSCPVSSSGNQDFYVKTTCPNGFYLATLRLQCRTVVSGNYQVFIMSPSEYSAYKLDDNKLPSIRFQTKDCIDHSLTFEKDQTLVHYWLDLKPALFVAKWWFSFTGICHDIQADLPVKMKIETSIITTFKNNPFDLSITLLDKDGVIAGNAKGKIKLSLNSTLNPDSEISSLFEMIPSWGNVTFQGIRISSDLPQVVLDISYTDGNYSFTEQFTMNITGTEVGFKIVHPKYVITNQPFTVDYYVVDSQNRVVQSKSTTQVKVGTNDSWFVSDGLFIKYVNSNGFTFTYLTKSFTDSVLSNGHGTVVLKSGGKGGRTFFFHLYITSALTITGESSVEVTNSPGEGVFDFLEGSFGSGSNTTFTVTIFDGSFQYYTPSIVKACNSVVRLVSNPPTIGFPLESVAVEGVAKFNSVIIITDPRIINIQIILDGSTLTNKAVKVGDNVKLSISLNTTAIAPGENFYGNITILDLFDNFLNMSSGKSFLNITYNGNQFLKIDSKVVNGTCTFSSVSIPKIYSSPVYVQAGFYSQLDKLFLSESIELPVYNMTTTDPKKSIQPQKSIVVPGNSIQPNNPSRSFNNNPTNPPTNKSNQRLNESTIFSSMIWQVIAALILFILQ